MWLPCPNFEPAGCTTLPSPYASATCLRWTLGDWIVHLLWERSRVMAPLSRKGKRSRLVAQNGPKRPGYQGNWTTLLHETDRASRGSGPSSGPLDRSPHPVPNTKWPKTAQNGPENRKIPISHLFGGKEVRPAHVEFVKWPASTVGKGTWSSGIARPGAPTIRISPLRVNSGSIAGMSASFSERCLGMMDSPPTLNRCSRGGGVPVQVA